MKIPLKLAWMTQSYPLRWFVVCQDDRLVAASDDNNAHLGKEETCGWELHLLCEYLSEFMFCIKEHVLDFLLEKSFRF